MKKSIFVSMINYINTVLKKSSLDLLKTWVGKNDFVNITLEESKHIINNMDDVFLESLRLNVDSAKVMIDNGYVVPEKIKKSLLNNMIMRVCFVERKDREKYFNNLIVNSSVTDKEIHNLAKFYVNNLLDDVFVNYFVNSQEKVKSNKDYSNFISNLSIFDIVENGEVSYKNRLYYSAVKQVLDKKLLDPICVIKNYKKTVFTAVIIVLLECKSDVLPFVTKDLIDDLNGYLNNLKRILEYKNRRKVKKPDSSEAQAFGNFFIKDMESLLSEINANRLNQVLGELKEIKLNTAIKESNFEILGKEFNSQKIDDILERTNNILNKLSVQNLSNEEAHNKKNITNSIEEVILNNLSLKELQRGEYVTDDLENQLSKLLNQLTDIYTSIVEKDLKILNNNLELRKYKI